jgi:DMSO/TMAO reductase YedYZ molybdopterin-dependent catalytic subunit
VRRQVAELTYGYGCAAVLVYGRATGHRGVVSRSSRALAALGGILSALAGLAAGSLVAAVLGSRQSPVNAVGSAVIDRVPPWLKDLAIQLFGIHDKTALRVGIVVVLLGLAAVAGVVGTFFPLLGVFIAAALSVVAVAAAASRPDSGTTDPVPSVIAGLVAVLLLWTFTNRLLRPAPSEGVTRRGFLQLAGGVALGSVAVAGAGRLIGGKRTAVTEARSRLVLPKPPTLQPPAGVQAAGAVPWSTPNADFYRIDTVLSLPLIEPTDWRLRIHGMVERELTLSFDDLLRRTAVHKWVTLCCVSNEVGGDLIGNALWSGVLLKDLLAEAGPAANADAVLATSKDGWTSGTPLTALTDDRQSLLAYEMNGQPLPIEHGFPVRVVVPGLYGYVSATKWVVDMEVSRFDRFDAYWTTRGWSEQGPIKIESRIDRPRSKASAGNVTVAGVAWHQHVGISAVEVRVDGGPWQRATLAADGSIDTWRQWHWVWNAPRGNHVLQVRAIDAAGIPQTEDEASPVPNGATGLHTVNITVT